MAALDQSSVDDLYDTVRRGVFSAFDALPTTRRQWKIGSYTRFQKLLEVLSRLAVRLRGDRAAQALDDGVRLATSPRVQLDPATYKRVGALIQRAAEAADDQALVERFPALMTLPLEGRDLPTGGVVERYFEPAQIIRSLDVETRAVPASVIDGLIETLGGGGPLAGDESDERGIAQAYAAMRLVALYQTGTLTDSQADRFGAAFWTLADESDAVPAPFPLGAEFALRVPPPPDGPDAAHRVRNTLLATLRDNSDHIGSATVGMPGTGVYFAPLRQATRSPDDPQDRVGVEWSPAEAAEILDAVQTWWTASGAKYAEEREREREHGVSIMSGADMLRDQLEIVPLILSDVVLPFLDDDQTDQAARVRRITDELGEADFATAVVAPYLLRFGLSDEQAFDLVRTDLYRDDVFASDLAAEAVYRWARLHQAGAASAPPEALVRDVLSALATRRGPELAGLASTTARIVSLVPDQFTEQDMSRLSSTLAVLERATAYPDSDTALVAPTLDDQDATVGAGVRAAVVGLARAASEWYSDHDLPPSSAVERWGEIARNAPLPETRRAWA